MVLFGTHSVGNGGLLQQMVFIQNPGYTCDDQAAAETTLLLFNHGAASNLNKLSTQLTKLTRPDFTELLFDCFYNPF